MKILSTFFMVVAAVSLLIGVVWRFMQKDFPLGQIPPDSFIEFTTACLLFAIALSVNQMSNKS